MQSQMKMALRMLDSGHGARGHAPHVAHFGPEVHNICVASGDSRLVSVDSAESRFHEKRIDGRFRMTHLA
jgi:hypothetical protein